jgi:hypothetical protein
MPKSLRIAFTAVICAIVFTSFTIFLDAKASDATYSCEAFARPSGKSLPRSLPCTDKIDGSKYYKSFNLYCEAKALQSDTRALGGCDKRFFNKQKSIYKP